MLYGYEQQIAWAQNRLKILRFRKARKPLQIWLFNSDGADIALLSSPGCRFPCCDIAVGAAAVAEAAAGRPWVPSAPGSAATLTAIHIQHWGLVRSVEAHILLAGDLHSGVHLGAQAGYRKMQSPDGALRSMA